MSVLDFIFPPKCKICHTRIKRGAVCPFCFDKLKQSESMHGFTLNSDGYTAQAYSLFPFENNEVKSLLYALKRNANGDLFKFSAELYSLLVRESEEKVCVVNVPRNRENVRKYGYDHVEKPCRIMCKGSKRLVFVPVLKRKEASDEQKNLTAAQRKINVAGKFAAVKKDIPKNILLVDDVITTSSTMCECMKTLYKAYPDAKITCISLACTNISDLSRK